MAEQTGIRERKKLRTREALIEAAADLCQRNGYDKTTVEQIAAAADVSTRTFSRYFPTKESVVAAMTGDMDRYLAAAIEAQPSDITEYEALFRAHLEVFRPESAHHTPAFRRMAVLIQIINNADSLRSAAFLQQRSAQERTAFVVMGNRMGVGPADSAVRIVADTWTVIFANAFAGLGTPGNEPLEPGVLCDRLRAQYELFQRTWLPWNADENTHRQPPTSAPGA